MIEEWRIIDGYDGLYEVSNMGRIKSLKFNKEIFLKGGINSNGYRGVVLYKKSLKKTYPVHQLVSIAFLGHKTCGNKIVIDHINFDRLDNRASNLQILTHTENILKTPKKCSESYIGVYICNNGKSWEVFSEINRRKKRIGIFTNKKDAVDSCCINLKIL